METRKSFSRVRAPRIRQTGGEPPAIIRPSSPTSGTDSPVRRKPAPTGGESPTSAASPLPPSPPHRRKPLSETPSKLRKQRSADKIQTAGVLWPSSKNPGPVAAITTLRDHLIEDSKAEEKDRANNAIPARAASTFSRPRGSLEPPALDDSINDKGHGSRGRRSKENHLFRYHFGKSRSSKKPGTPPSPSSSSSSGPLPPPHRLSVDENAFGRRRSEFDLDFPSTESDRSETRNPSPRISRAPIKIAKIRSSGSPIRRSRSPVVRSSLSPVQHKSRSPVLHKSRSPVLHKPRSPVLHKSRSPVLIRRPRSPAPMEAAAKTAPGPQRQSPDKGWNSGGMGSIISQGIGSLFRRKSFSGATMGSSSPKLTAVNGSSPARGVLASMGSPSRGGVIASMGSPSRGGAVIATSMGSPARGFQTEVAQHEFKVMHNQLFQWRFLNGGTAAVIDHKSAVAEKELESAWVGLSELQAAVAQKRMQLAKQKLSFKLKSIIYLQVKGLERWGKMEKQHAAALSSTADSFHAVVCRLPLTDRSKADSQILSILLRQASKVAAEINANIAACDSMAQRTVQLLAELAEIVSAEKPLIEECYEFLGMVFNLQFQEESLRCQLIQLKS